MDSVTSNPHSPSNGDAQPVQAAKLFAVDPIQLRRVLTTELSLAKSLSVAADDYAQERFWDGYVECCSNLCRWLQQLEGDQ